MKSSKLQNRYRINQEVNQGGMSRIYSAWDTHLNIGVIIKESDCRKFADQPESVRQSLKNAFRAEAELLASLNHPAIPRAIDYFIEADSQYLVMETVGGMSLEKIISRHRASINKEQIFDWFGQLLDVIEYLHTLENPVIHRDIKPANINLDRRGRIFLLDFGISKILRDEQFNAGDTLQFATPDFASLEQSIKASAHIRNSLMTLNPKKTEGFLREKTSFQTDIFSLGATLYRLLTGQLPLNAHVRALSIWSDKPDPITPLSCLDHTFPSELDSFIMQSLSIFPALRPKSVASFKQKIKASRKIRSNDLPFLHNTEDPMSFSSKPIDSSAIFQQGVHFNAMLRQLDAVKALNRRQAKELENYAQNRN